MQSDWWHQTVETHGTRLSERFTHLVDTIEALTNRRVLNGGIIKIHQGEHDGNTKMEEKWKVS